jgi:dihydrolipoyl dehydrogenase
MVPTSLHSISRTYCGAYGGCATISLPVRLKTTEELGESVISGRARLLAPDRLTVNGQELRAHNILSHPVVPKSWRELEEQLLTTDSLFEQETLLSRMVVVGMGPIGVEMSQALFGSALK